MLLRPKFITLNFCNNSNRGSPLTKPKTLFEVEDPPYTFFWIFNINTFIINTYVPFAKIKSLPTVVRSRSSHILMWLHLLCSLWLLPRVEVLPNASYDWRFTQYILLGVGLARLPNFSPNTVYQPYFMILNFIIYHYRTKYFDIAKVGILLK